MKLKGLLLGAATLAIMSVVSNSCTKETLSPYPDTESTGQKTSMLVHTPDFYAWSGAQQFGASRAALSRAGEGASEITVKDISTTDIDRDKEAKIIDEYLPEQNGNLNEGVQPNFLFKAEKETTFQLYPVYCQTSTPKTVGIFYYDNDGNYHEINAVFDGITQWEGMTKTTWDWSPELGQTVENIWYFGKEITIPEGYIFGFFWNGNTNDWSNPNGTATTYYSVEAWNEEVACTNGGGQEISPKQTSKVHGVTFELEGKTYLGLEDWTDFDFQDLVFTCPDNLTEIPVTDIPAKGEPWPKETFPGGTDNNGGGTGETTKPNPGGDENNGGETTEPNEPNVPEETPGNNGDETPATKHHNDEVEVNFSINDAHTDANGQKYDNADLWTKLSIHVRKGTDVKIHVPLPARYFCESDDFAIMQNHANGIYTGTNVGTETPGAIGEDGIYHHAMTYTIVGNDKIWEVTLHIDIAANGMDIWTDGIEQELIDYLFEKNGDGMNFEIWNYFQTETIDWIDGEKHVTPTLTQEEYDAFQGILNQSTIEFLDDAPSYYINSFGYEQTDGADSSNIRPGDCTVTPLYGNQFDLFPSYCYHLNNTPWNIVWSKAGIDKESNDYKAHTATPTPAVPVSIGN